MVGLARLPLVYGYARTPPFVFRLGWNPSLRSNSHDMPPLPMEYLKEKEVLREFIVRANTIGKRLE